MGLFSTSDVDLIDASAKFPVFNPLGHAKNGERTRLELTLRNRATHDLTLTSASASFHDLDHHWKLVRNASLHEFKKPTPILASSNLSFPYYFHTEFKPKEYGLTVWVNGIDYSGHAMQKVVYNSTVTVVEPPKSILDPSLLFLYIVVGSLLGLVGYSALKTYLPSLFNSSPSSSSSSSKSSGNNNSHKKGSKKSSGGFSPSSTSTAEGATVVVPASSGKPYPASVEPYEDEWIPAHLLGSKTKKTREGDKSAGEDGMNTGGIKVRKTKGKKN